MDIHPPHPIHTWKDFGVQLVTITAGILIALSLEGVRESLHDRALVREARENIRREITDNQREVDGEIAAIPGRRTPGRNILALNRADATIAPVFPAETSASPSPRATRSAATAIEASGFAASASAGFSSISTNDGA